MRILHVFDHSLPLQSGYVTRSLGIIGSQRARGWQTIHVTTPRHPTSAAICEAVDGIEFYRTPGVGTALPVLRELLEIRATRRRLVEIARRERPDVIHAHSPVLNVIPALSVGKQLGIPVVYEVRALWEDAAVDHGTTREGAPRYRLSRMIDTWAMRRADGVVAICEPLRQEIVARGIPANKVSVVPNAVDRSLITEGPIQLGDQRLRDALGIGQRTVLGFVGSFYAYEGLELLLRVAKTMRTRRSDFVVLLVGGGPTESRLKHLVEEMQLGDFVRFVGRVHHSEVSRYYRLIDLLVFPRERMRLTDLVTPLKPLEAMAQLKPVVASDVGGHRELIHDGETGLLFPAGNETALATCLEQLISDPARRARLAEVGRRFVEKNRTWDTIAGGYAQTYERVGVYN